VRERMPEPPSKRHPGISRDLEIIVLKCLEKEPERRYSSAAALADDLGRHLNGEPILARPSGLAVRAWMWCKRNPVPVLSSALAIAVLIMLFASLGMVLLERGRRREAEARALAVTNYNLVKQSVDDYFT